MKIFLRLMKEPEIETRIVIIRAARNSADIGPKFVLKNGVRLRISEIIMKNIIKIRNRTRASLTEISVETFFRFNPKKVPMRVCQVGEIMTVSFQTLRFGFAESGVFMVWRFGGVASKSFGFTSWSAVAIGKISVISNRIIISLFIFDLDDLNLNNLAMFKSWEDI